MKRKTSIIILTYNQLEYTKKCLQSIRKYTEKGTYEIIIIDNHSTDGTKTYLKRQKDIKVLFNNKNAGFPKGCNQGIALAGKGNDILLLNNDTIVTPNYLANLKKALYSHPKVGAVGAVCNQNENLQGVDFTYTDLKQMQRLAKKNNVSDSTRWEEKVFLIGFCLLIKREVIQKIGRLDENYSPGYIEDNDLSLRILNLNYRLLLCHDAFIHHYLGTSFRKDLTKFYPILYKNRAYFESKWHFSTFAFDQIKSSSFPLIEKVDSLLELDAGLGVTLLILKYRFKIPLIEGIEKNPFLRHFACKRGKVYRSLRAIKEKKYDCILIGDLLERVKDPAKFLLKLKKHLTKEGSIIGTFTNGSSINYFRSLLEGKSLEIKRRIYSYPMFLRLLNKTQFQTPYFYSWYNASLEKDEPWISSLKEKYPIVQYDFFTFRLKR